MFDNLARRLSGIISALGRGGRVTEDDVAGMLREVRVALLEADVNFGVAKEFVAAIKAKAVGEEIYGTLTPDQTIIRIVRDELTTMLGGDEPVKFQWASAPPTVVLLCGLQGSGKTTTAAKLAKWMVAQGKKPMMAACDLQRPAAIKQLEVLGEQIDVPVFTKIGETSAVAVAKEALERAKYLMNDVLIVDTAGRLQIDDVLMDELQKVEQAVKPTESLLVVDSTTGQESVNVARAFHEKVGITGAIFTKLDGDTRGGAVLSVRAATGVPVRFIGLGEQIDTLDVFHPDRMAQRILGMGDILGIIEKAEAAIDRDDAEAMQAKWTKGSVDFNDFLSNFQAVRKMGPIQNVMKMIPGLGINIPEEALNKMDDGHINRIEAMILSMTPKERAYPDILNGSRRKRIAAGSGSTVEDVNALIKQMYEMRRQMKQFGKAQAKMSKFARLGRRR
jgi:signal recognition particle subunit SRP54